MQFKFFPLSIFTLISLSCTSSFAEENKDTNPYRAQDISLKTPLYKNDGLSFYLEVDAGYRHDHINNDLEFYDPLWDVEGGREQKMDFTQLNFRAGAVIAKYLFIKGMIGYAFLNHDKDHEASYFVGSDYLVNTYTKTFSSGHAYDALIGGGVRIPLYPEYLVLDAEIGYDYKTFTVKNSLQTTAESPYVGGTLYGTPGWGVQFAVYGNYFFLPSLKEKGYLYLIQSQTFTPSPGLDTDHGLTAYTIGANLSYMVFDHLSLNFNWERFSMTSGYKNGDFAIPYFGSIVTGAYKARLDYWTSNQYTLGFRYTF